MVKGFSKMYSLSFFGQFFFAIFLLFNWILQKKVQFLQIRNFFADSKSRAQELFNDVSFVIFGHQTWDLEGGGGKLIPPPRVSWFSSTPAGIGLRKTKNVQISFDGLFANNLQKFLCKTCLIRYLTS